MLLGLVGGAAYFGSLEIDPTKPIFVRPKIPHLNNTPSKTILRKGIDPMFVYGGATVGCVGASLYVFHPMSSPLTD